MSLERIKKARSALLISQPFFGTLALGLELVEDGKVETIVTNGRHLRFNPEWADALPMPNLEAVVAHQVMHCAFGHIFRREGRDAKLWDDACDHVVNHELAACQFDLPQGSLMNPQFKGMTAEAVYSVLHQKEEPGDDQPGAGGQSQPGSGRAGGTDPGQPSPGESATGRIEDAVDEEGDPADAAEAAQQEADWQTAVAQAAQVSRASGRLPGAIERAMESLLAPRVDWREALMRYFKAKAKEDYNWSRPNRRYLPIYLPSLDSQRIGPVAVAIDMSGSITQKMIDQFVSELLEIRDEVKPEEIVVMAFDTRVRGEALRIRDDEPIEIKARAGGGTAFDDPVRVLDEMGIEPEVLVYLTDLDASVFPVQPQYPVLWVVTPGGRSKAPFGDIINMI